MRCGRPRDRRLQPSQPRSRRKQPPRSEWRLSIGGEPRHASRVVRTGMSSPPERAGLSLGSVLWTSLSGRSRLAVRHAIEASRRDSQPCLQGDRALADPVAGLRGRHATGCSGRADHARGTHGMGACAVCLRGGGGGLRGVILTAAGGGHPQAGASGHRGRALRGGDRRAASRWP